MLRFFVLLLLIFGAFGEECNPEFCDVQEDIIPESSSRPICERKILQTPTASSWQGRQCADPTTGGYVLWTRFSRDPPFGSFT